MDDGSKRTPRITVGADLGDRYSYLCFVDTQSGEVLEESGAHHPGGFERRFGSERSLPLEEGRSEDCSTLAEPEKTDLILCTEPPRRVAH